MAWTDTQMATLILQKLQMLVSGESPTAADQTVTLDVYTSRMEYLRDDELVWYADNDVPDAVADVVAEYMLPYVGTMFAVSQAERGEYMQRSMLADQQLRRNAAKRSEGAAVQADYF